MSNNNGSGVAVDVATQTAQAEPDNSHLIVEITQECYDAIQATRERASGRGLQDGFEYWLCRLAVQHAKVQENLWDKADDSSIFSRAQKGNTQAKIAVLASLGIKGDAAKQFLATLK